MATSDARGINIWDVLNLKTSLTTFNQHKSAVKALAWCPYEAGSLATGGGYFDGKMYVWNCNSGKVSGSVNLNSQITGEYFHCILYKVHCKILSKGKTIQLVDYWMTDNKNSVIQFSCVKSVGLDPKVVDTSTTIFLYLLFYLIPEFPLNSISLPKCTGLIWSEADREILSTHARRGQSTEHDEFLYNKIHFWKYQSSKYDMRRLNHSLINTEEVISITNNQRFLLALCGFNCPKLYLWEKVFNKVPSQLVKYNLTDLNKFK